MSLSDSPPPASDPRTARALPRPLTICSVEPWRPTKKRQLRCDEDGACDGMQHAMLALTLLIRGDASCGNDVEVDWEALSARDGDIGQHCNASHRIA